MNKKIQLLSKLLVFPFLFSNFNSLAMENFLGKKTRRKEASDTQKLLNTSISALENQIPFNQFALEKNLWETQLKYIFYQQQCYQSFCNNASAINLIKSKEFNGLYTSLLETVMHVFPDNDNENDFNIKQGVSDELLTMFCNFTSYWISTVQSGLKGLKNKGTITFQYALDRDKNLSKLIDALKFTSIHFKNSSNHIYKEIINKMYEVINYIGSTFYNQSEFELYYKIFFNSPQESDTWSPHIDIRVGLEPKSLNTNKKAYYKK